MQRRFRRARLVSAAIFVVLGVGLLAAAVWVEGALVLSLGVLLFVRVFAVRDVPGDEEAGRSRKGGRLPPPDAGGDSDTR